MPRNNYMGEGFSTDRYCPKCKETKKWTSFYIEAGMCTKCYSVWITREVDVVPSQGKGMQAKKVKTTMDDLIAFIDKRTRNTDGTDA